VALYRLLEDEERGGDLLVRAAGGDQLGDFALAGGEGVVAARGALGLAREPRAGAAQLSCRGVAVG
jgi:hypothetical protein